MAVVELSKIAMVLPAETQVIGRNFKPFKIGEPFKGIETPDDRNVINIYSRNDSVLVLSNPNDVNFCIMLTTTKDGKGSDLALIEYYSNEHVIRINDNWIVHESFIENKLPNNRSTHKPLASKELAETMIQIVLKEDQIKSLGSNTAFSAVGMRFNDGPLVRFGFVREKLSFIAFD